MIFTRARNLEDGECTECFLFVFRTEHGMLNYSILTTGSIWRYSNLPSCLTNASTVRNQEIRALATERQWWGILNHTPRTGPVFEFENRFKQSYQHMFWHDHFFNLSLIANNLWIAMDILQELQLKHLWFYALISPPHETYIPARTMDKYLNCANRSQVHSKGTVWYHGKVFIDPRVIVHRWKNSRLEFAPIHPSLRDNGHPPQPWVYLEHGVYWSLLRCSLSDVYSPFFHFWVMPALRCFQTKSLSFKLTRLEPDWPRLVRHPDYNDKSAHKSMEISSWNPNFGFLDCAGIFPIVTVQQFHAAGSRLLIRSDRAATGLIYITMDEHPALWYIINPTRFPQRGSYVCQEASIKMAKYWFGPKKCLPCPDSRVFGGGG